MFIHLLCIALFAVSGIRAEVADVVIFSNDRPLQLYALLESIEMHMQGVGQTAVIYRASDNEYREAYRQVTQKFDGVKFLEQGLKPREDFKPLTMQATFKSPSEYVIFALDDSVLRDTVDLAVCIDALQKTNAYAFSLRLGENIDFCANKNQAQRVPELTVIQDDILSWRFAGAESDWGYPHTIEMTLFSKKEIEAAFRSMDYDSPLSLEIGWARKAAPIMNRLGLCFRDAKMVNVSLQVQGDAHAKNKDLGNASLLKIFQLGNKLDISRLWQLKSPAVRMRHDPAFVQRAGQPTAAQWKNSLPGQAFDMVLEIQKSDPAESLEELVAQSTEKNDEWYKKISHIEQKSIVIVTPSYKNIEWYKWNLDSVFDQNYENWHMIYVDDCSPDGTGELVKAYVKERGFEHKVTVICNKVRRKALANLYTAIYMCAPTDIVVVLDGDDRLAFNDVLCEVNFMYSAYDVWLTYGQYKTYPEGGMGFCHAYPDDVIEKSLFRYYQDGPSHLRTFYAGLFHKIKLEDLVYDGEFFPMTYDLAIMLPMIEMARAHFMFCATPLLEYNTLNPINDHKVSRDLQRACDLAIRAQKPYEEIKSLF